MAFLGELAGYGNRVHVVPQDEMGLLGLPTYLPTYLPGSTSRDQT